MAENDVNVWLINTGWSGGEYGVGERISLKFTRAMITSALEGKLDNVAYTNHKIFGLAMPNECENVPTDILNPKNTWADKAGYDEKANHLAGEFNKNFEQFADNASDEILAAAPVAKVTA